MTVTNHFTRARAGAIGRAIAFLCITVFAPGDSLVAQELPPLSESLTNVALIRELSATEASRALPVHLTGVVVGQLLQAPAVFLADDTGEIYVVPSGGKWEMLNHFGRGDMIQLDGVTDAGGFAPMLHARHATKLGNHRLPDAQPVTYDQVLTGALDGQWVEIRGVVRQVLDPWPKSDIWRIVVSVGGGRLPVRFATASHPERIAADSEVRVRAICFSQYNKRRQFLNPVLEVPRGEPVVVEASPPEDPYTVPVRDVADLRTFSPANLRAYTHRVHVRGTVISRQPGSFVWIRDGTMGLCIQTSQADGELNPGDRIDVLGFLALAAYPPALEDAVFRKTGSGPAPAPVRLSNFSQAFEYDNDLVALDADLIRVQSTSDGTILRLQLDKEIFDAVINKPAGDPVANVWQPGSRVRVTGICSSTYNDPRPFAGIWRPKSFQILLRSPADVAVLVRPPWWTPQHTTYVFAGVSVILLLVAALGITFSRRHLNEQARRRAMAEAEFAAILIERNRMAREIHDALAQGLAATSVQLRLAKKHSGSDPAKLNHYLETAQQFVRGSLEEARNSIWNARSQVLESGDLADALRGILKQMADGTDVKTQFDVTGRVRRFAPVIENNLLRVGQEAITNATKHARAKMIQVSLEFGEKHFRLSVRDDGRGFHPAQPPSSGGGFGLVGMRERARELNGELDIHTINGSGTEVSLTVPLASNE